MVSDASAGKFTYKNLTHYATRYATKDDALRAEKRRVLTVMDLTPVCTKAAVFVRSVMLRSLNRSGRRQGTQCHEGQRAGGGQRTSEARATDYGTLAVGIRSARTSAHVAEAGRRLRHGPLLVILHGCRQEAD